MWIMQYNGEWNVDNRNITENGMLKMKNNGEWNVDNEI
jgi:hypothetical protein